MKRIVVTRPKSQANAMITGLIAAGFQPIEFPVIEIHRLAENTGLERALSRLECYDWMVFTSTNAVDAVWEQMSRLGIGQIPANVRIAAIGPKTAGILSAHGMEPSFIPSKYTAEAIMPGLGDLRGRWVLLPRSEIARKVLPDAIVTAGGVAHEIVVYRTLPAEADIAGVAALKEGVDVITFTSTSTGCHQHQVHSVLNSNRCLESKSPGDIAYSLY